MTAGARWSAALAASLLVHAGLVAGLALAVLPAPPPPQEGDGARLDLAVYPVARSDAAEAQPETEAVAEGSAAAPRSAGSAIPSSSASAVPVAAEPAASPVPDPERIAGAAPRAERLRSDSRGDRIASAPVAGAAVGADDPAGEAVSTAVLSGTRLPTSVPDRVALEPVIDAAAQTLPAAAPDRRPLDAAQPEAQALATAAPEAASVAVAAAIGEAGQPALPPAVAVEPAPAGAPLLTTTAVTPSPVAAIAAAGPRARPVVAAVAISGPVPAPRDVALRAPLGAERAPPASAAPEPAAAVQVRAAALAPASPAGPLAAAVQRPETTSAAIAPAPGRARQTAAAALAAASPGETPPAVAAPPAPVSASASPSLPPPADRATATLAWTGEGEVDPVSLAAIAAFAADGDLTAAAREVRDEIGQLLSSVPCARLQTAFDPATGALELRGHIPEEGLRAPVLAALSQQMGASVPITDNVLILPRPQCGALSGLAGAGLPQSDEQETNPRIVGAGTHARIYRFTEGERLQFGIEAPDYPAWFYVDYYDADGAVLHLMPNHIVPLAAISLGERVVVGAPREDGGPALDLVVQPPFGQEILAAYAASQPLFDGVRPLREDAAAYLRDLAAAVARARAADPAFKGEWVYFFVATGPRR